MEAYVSPARTDIGMGPTVCSTSLQTSQSKARRLYHILRRLVNQAASLEVVSVTNALKELPGTARTA